LVALRAYNPDVLNAGLVGLFQDDIVDGAGLERL